MIEAYEEDVGRAYASRHEALHHLVDGGGLSDLARSTEDLDESAGTEQPRRDLAYRLPFVRRRLRPHHARTLPPWIQVAEDLDHLGFDRHRPPCHN